MATLEIPPSREVRLADGVTHGIETQLVLAHTGGADGLLRSMDEAELIIAHERSQAAKQLANLLRDRIRRGFGNATPQDINQMLNLFHENEVLGIRHEPEVEYDDNT